MGKIWLTSDLHLCHDKEFIYKQRGFHSVHEMNEQIIKNFNEVIDDDDDLYLLGDLMLNDNVTGMKLLNQLPGRKHIILGNHDTDARVELYKTGRQVVEILGCASILKYNKFHFYLCHYPTMTANFDLDKYLSQRLLSLSGHTHSQDKWDLAGGYNVALDAHNCYPVEINTIIQDFKNKYS